MAESSNILDAFDQNAVLVLIESKFPVRGRPRFVTEDGKTTTISTANRIILLVEFTIYDGRLAIHIPSERDDDDDFEFSWKLLMIGPLQFLEQNLPHLPIPRVHLYHLGYEPPVNVPFMIFDWIEGTSLSSFTDEWPPKIARHRILNDLSDFLLDLTLCPVDSAENICFYGSYPCLPISPLGIPAGTLRQRGASTEAWLRDSIDRALQRNFQATDVETIISYLIKRSMIPDMVVWEYNAAPWVLNHIDLHGGNIIVDEQFIIKGIIDWDFTVAAPLQKAATWPKLLQYTPGAVPYGHSDQFMSHPADQEIFLQLLRQKERIRNGSETVANLVETSYERNFFELSLQMKSVHNEWVRAHPPTKEQYHAAVGQLISLQRRNPQPHDAFRRVLTELKKRLAEPSLQIGASGPEEEVEEEVVG
jgi:aminoglycoside phosphotransferase (APT) family kinase protein